MSRDAAELALLARQVYTDLCERGFQGQQATQLTGFVLLTSSIERVLDAALASSEVHIQAPNPSEEEEETGHTTTVTSTVQENRYGQTNEYGQVCCEVCSQRAGYYVWHTPPYCEAK